MKMLSMLIGALLGTGLVQAAPTDGLDGDVLVTPNKTYNIVDIDWFIEVNDTASPHNLTVAGTIQDLFGNLSVADPQAAATINQSVAGALNETNPSELQERGAFGNPTTTYCVLFPDNASVQRIRDGINYLKSVPGKPKNGPGPGACGRVSCSYNSAIWWCNDNKETKVLDSYGQIADGAQIIVDYCDPNWIHASVQGQQFFDDGWNVIVRGASC